MKKLLFLSVLMLMALLSSTVFGQNSGTAIKPSIGDVFTYHVNSHSGNTYSWTLQTDLNVGGTDLFAASDPIATNAGTNSSNITITWVKPSTTTIYYLHVVETKGSCSNHKVLAIQPVNNFKLDIANVDNAGNLMTGTNSVTYSTCAPTINSISWNSSAPVSESNAKDFSYNYDKVVFYYKITASGINFSNTSWTPNIAVTQTNAANAVVTIDTQVGETLGSTWDTTPILTKVSSNEPTIPAGSGKSVIWVRITVDNKNGTPSTANENITSSDFVIKLNSAKDQYNNPAVSLGNITTTQTQLARPDTGDISY